MDNRQLVDIVRDYREARNKKREAYREEFGPDLGDTIKDIGKYVGKTTKEWGQKIFHSSEHNSDELKEVVDKDKSKDSIFQRMYNKGRDMLSKDIDMAKSAATWAAGLKDVFLGKPQGKHAQQKEEDWLEVGFRKGLEGMKFVLGKGRDALAWGGKKIFDKLQEFSDNYNQRAEDAGKAIGESIENAKEAKELKENLNNGEAIDKAAKEEVAEKGGAKKFKVLDPSKHPALAALSGKEPDLMKDPLHEEIKNSEVIQGLAGWYKELSNDEKQEVRKQMEFVTDKSDPAQRMTKKVVGDIDRYDEIVDQIKVLETQKKALEDRYPDILGDKEQKTEKNKDIKEEDKGISGQEVLEKNQDRDFLYENQLKETREEIQKIVDSGQGVDKLTELRRTYMDNRSQLSSQALENWPENPLVPDGVKGDFSDEKHVRNVTTALQDRFHQELHAGDEAKALNTYKALWSYENALEGFEKGTEKDKNRQGDKAKEEYDKYMSRDVEKEGQKALDDLEAYLHRDKNQEKNDGKEKPKNLSLAPEEAQPSKGARYYDAETGEFFDIDQGQFLVPEFNDDSLQDLMKHMDQEKEAYSQQPLDDLDKLDLSSLNKGHEHAPIENDGGLMLA